MEVIYFNEKVKDFIKELDPVTEVRVRKTLSLLEKLGHLIDLPDSKSLGRGLFELRTLGKKKVRILYVFNDGKAWVVHGFIKKSWRINIKDIEYARRLQKYINN